MSIKAIEHLKKQHKDKKEYYATEVARLENDKRRTLGQIDTLLQYMEDRKGKVQSKGMAGVFGDQIKNQFGYFEKIQQAIDQQHYHLRAIESSIVKNKELMSKSSYEEKKLEIVLDKRLEAVRYAEARVEQKFYDEFASRKFFAGRK